MTPGTPVAVLVGSACEHHPWPVDLRQHLQGRYGVVMDPAQMAACYGPPPDPGHAVFVRFVRPYADGAVRSYGGWYRPDECFERYATGRSETDG